MKLNLSSVVEWYWRFRIATVVSVCVLCAFFKAASEQLARYLHNREKK